MSCKAALTAVVAIGRSLATFDWGVRGIVRLPGIETRSTAVVQHAVQSGGMRGRGVCHPKIVIKLLLRVRSMQAAFCWMTLRIDGKRYSICN